MPYSAYGIHIDADLPLPGFASAGERGPVDTRVWLSSQPPWLKSQASLPRREYPKADYHSSSGEVIRKVFEIGESDFFQLVYCDGTEFVVSGDGDRIHAQWPSPLTFEDTLTYLVGPILGIALRLKGRICLHASAVAIDGRAILFIGAAGAGKSTTAAALTMGGARLLTDDVVVVHRSNGQYWIEPGHGWIRLWPGSVGLLCGAEDALPLLTPNWSKRYLDATTTLPSAAMPLSHIFLLGGFDQPETPPRLFTPATPQETLLLMSCNTYAPAFVEPELRRTEFDLFSGLARDVPATILRRRAESLTMQGLVDAIHSYLS